MTANEKQMNFTMFPDITQRNLLEALRSGDKGKLPAYDPELLYVECQACGKPVIWEPGKTTALLRAAGVDVSKLDERCMIISEGCPSCQPSLLNGFTLAVVRLAGLTPEEAAYMMRPGGTA
ncbi:hypothetical protein LJC46_09060 [Desulfovibrio sp. OttesenSCG-928-G15]|nr:hypothetical protein [Desulfovibrio sp. OttesenSCG-928-G15]